MGILADILAGALSGQGGMDERDTARSAPPRGPDSGMADVIRTLLPIVLAMLATRGGGAGQAGTGGGGLGDILGQVLSGRSGGGLGDILGQVLGGGGSQAGRGGLGALLEQLQQAGYGDQGRSWVSTGQNLPIPPEAIEQIFGRGGLSEIARQAGLSEADASRGLSELLPEVVDHVTPKGDVPDADSLAASVDDLARRLGLA